MLFRSSKAPLPISASVSGKVISVKRVQLKKQESPIDSKFSGRSIRNSAFSGCADLSQVSLPEELEQIEASAFKGCSSLQKIILPDSVKLGMYAFSNTGLKIFTVPGGNEKAEFRIVSIDAGMVTTFNALSSKAPFLFLQASREKLSLSNGYN